MGVKITILLSPYNSAGPGFPGDQEGRGPGTNPGAPTSYAYPGKRLLGATGEGNQAAGAAGAFLPLGIILHENKIFSRVSDVRP